MTRRRRFLQATGASAAAILLNPTGLMAGRSPTRVAQLPAQEWEGFLLVPPGGVRPRRSVPAGPGWPEVTEGSAAGTPTVHTVDLMTGGGPRSDGVLSGLDYDAAELTQTAANQLVANNGLVLQETRVFATKGAEHLRIAVTKMPGIQKPYVVMPLGTPESGYVDWVRTSFLGRAALTAPGGRSSLALCFAGPDLLRLDIETTSAVTRDQVGGLVSRVNRLLQH